MKLKYTFESVDMGDEIISVPVGEGALKVQGVLKLNAEGREILDMLKADTTEKQIVDALEAKYENDRAMLVRYVGDALRSLRDAGLIEE